MAFLSVIMLQPPPPPLSGGFGTHSGVDTFGSIAAAARFHVLPAVHSGLVLQVPLHARCCVSQRDERALLSRLKTGPKALSYIETLHLAAFASFFEDEKCIQLQQLWQQLL